MKHNSHMQTSTITLKLWQPHSRCLFSLVPRQLLMKFHPFPALFSSSFSLPQWCSLYHLCHRWPWQHRYPALLRSLSRYPPTVYTCHRETRFISLATAFEEEEETLSDHAFLMSIIIPCHFPTVAGQHKCFGRLFNVVTDKHLHI